MTGKPHLYRRAASRGLWIAFFGPDGVGKSAVIAGLQQQLPPAFDGVTRFHFRPRFRRNRLDRPAVTLPHAKAPRSLMISRVKLIYWLIDCWYGYWMSIRSGKRRNQLVIFDRYFPDALVDPLRYRLPTTAVPFAAGLSGFLPHPDLYVLLDAPAEASWERKSELPLAELQRQRDAYLRLFAQLPRKLLVNADCPLQEVISSVGFALNNLRAELLPNHEPLPCPPLI